MNLGYQYKVFNYKKGCVSPPKQPQNLDPSCKMDLDIWLCFGRLLS